MEAYRLYAGTQSGMIIFRGVGDIWTSMGGSREFEPYFKNKVVDSVYGCRYLGRSRAAEARHKMAATAGDSRFVGCGGRIVEKDFLPAAE